MAAPITTFFAKGRSMRLLKLTGCVQRFLSGSTVLRRTVPSRCASFPTKNLDVCSVNRSLTRTSNSVFFSSDAKVTLEDFAEDLNVQEKPKRYQALSPVDDVYMIADYPPNQVSLQDALEQLRIQARWRYLEGTPYEARPIELSIHLNMTVGEKKMPAFSDMFVPPHHFDKTNTVICFAEGEEAKRAEESGANLVVGTEGFPDIESGEILVSDYDYCVASRAFLPHLSKIKKFLRNNYPNTRRGSAGVNIEEIVRRHRYGKTYKSLDLTNMIHHCPIAEFGLSDDQIEDNVRFLLNTVLKHRPSPEEPFIRKVQVRGHRLSSYQIDFQHYLPKETAKAEKVDTRTELERIEDELRELRAS